MDNQNRRPLKARGWGIMKIGARWLCDKNITPNQISLACVACAALSGLCLISLSKVGGFALWPLSFLAAFFILGRALCNVFDGMVAIEGGKGTRSGELFNDIPDRIADLLIIVSAGYATTVVGWADDLGWCAGALAVMTAYVRTLARGVGAPSDFRGPMSKVPRMALIGAACLMTPWESMFWQTGTSLLIALIIIALGCVVTVWNRAHAAYLYLEGKSDA